MFIHHYRKIIISFLIIVTISVISPLKSYALVFVPINNALESAPTAVKRTTDTTMLQVKNYVLDGLAWTVAKIMLQQVTNSVVEWVNRGFEGSPAFITDPGSFFADAADQLTGNFISKTGILSQLCSPFSLDIRLSLALNSSYNSTKYACTLNTVINNVKNSRASVNGSVTNNGRTVASGSTNASINGGASIDGFVNGDFSQGGWVAFNTMTSQPQNNVYGAYLKAKSDLQQQIASKQNNIRVDLSVGQGFMSFKRCTDVTADQLGAYDELGVNTDKLQNTKSAQSINIGQDYYSGADYSLTKKIDPKTGKATYKDCKTETPGSVIAGSVNKALGVPQDTLNIAGSLNQIVGAVFAQLVTRVLSGGLHAAGSQNGNYTAAAATELISEQQGKQIASTRNQLSASTQGYYSTAQQYVDIRKQAYNVVAGAQAPYQAALQCFATKSAGTASTDITSAQLGYAENQSAAIGSALIRVENVTRQFKDKLEDAQTRLNATQALINRINGAVGTDQLQTVSNDFNVAVQGGSAVTPAFVSPNDLLSAQNDLQFAQDQVATFAKEAKAYQDLCNNFSPHGF